MLNTLHSIFHLTSWVCICYYLVFSIYICAYIYIYTCRYILNFIIFHIYPFKSLKLEAIFSHRHINKQRKLVCIIKQESGGNDREEWKGETGHPLSRERGGQEVVARGIPSCREILLSFLQMYSKTLLCIFLLSILTT